MLLLHEQPVTNNDCLEKVTENIAIDIRDQHLGSPDIPV